MDVRCLLQVLVFERAVAPEMSLRPCLRDTSGATSPDLLKKCDKERHKFTGPVL